MQTILDLDNPDIYQAELDVAKARTLIDHLPEGDFDELASELDEAQSDVFSKKKELVYLVITIVP